MGEEKEMAVSPKGGQSFLHLCREERSEIKSYRSSGRKSRIPAEVDAFDLAHDERT